ncbi:AbrB/MazE/SpoVT family DNA-binding domain-containing protein [Candidatus Woesearchaeota archaeon]|nr:AbrB/MazE/SpoVT family DNA-binding domain-containing protein [Candidatus Woesearchaeota archaeon]
MTDSIVRIGPKGQIVIKKEYRDKLGIKTGNYVETIIQNDTLLIKPVNVTKELEKIKKLRSQMSKNWPKGLNSVEAVKEQRE